MLLYLCDELQEKDEEAIVESTATRWRQPDLAEIRRIQMPERDEVASQAWAPKSQSGKSALPQPQV